MWFVNIIIKTSFKKVDSYGIYVTYKPTITILITEKTGIS